MTQISLQENDTKLDGIESGATADQTDAEIRAAVEAATDSNVFTDDESLKLFGIETAANNYTHPTGAGNNHIPSGGSADQILTYSSAGTAQWTDPAGGGVFPFSDNTWTTASFVNDSGHLYTFTAPNTGNGIFIIGRCTVRSNNTSVNGSFYGSVSGTGSWLTFGGAYGGYMYTGGGAGFGGTIAGNPIQHGMHGFIGPGGTISFNGSNFYSTTSAKYKSV